MKKRYVILFVLLSVVIGFIPALIYLLKFNESILPLGKVINNISKDNQAWGNFGSFLSGTTGALFSFIGTLAVIWTLIKTHEASEKQISMLSNEQTFNQFNNLLNVLIDMLEKKRFPSLYVDTMVEAKLFRPGVYEHIAKLFNKFIKSNNEKIPTPEYFKGLLAAFYQNYTEKHAPEIYTKENALYTVLLDRIMTADESTKEAMIAILLAKVDEHHLFFLNCDQISGIKNQRLLRMVKSSIPFSVPNEMLDLIEIDEKDPFWSP